MGSKNRLNIFLIVAGTILLGWGGLTFLEQKSRLSSLPALPEPKMANALPHVVAQVEQAYQQALKNPKDADASGLLGMVYHAYNDFSSAAVCYERAGQLAPGDFRWSYLLGLAQNGLGKNDQALESIRRSLDSQDYFPARIELGKTLLLSGKVEESHAVLSEAALIRPDSPLARYSLASVLLEMGDHSGALQELNAALARSPKYGAAHYAAATAQRSLGNASAAEEHLRLYRLYEKTRPPLDDPLFQEVINLDIGVSRRMRYARFLLDSNRIDESLIQYEKVIELDRENTIALANLITVYGKVRRMDDARNAYARALEASPDWPEAHYLMGRVLVEVGDYERGIEYLERAISVSPVYPDAYTQLGLAWEKKNQMGKALENYRSALKDEPGHSAANLFTGLRLIASDEKEEGRRHLEKALASETQKRAQYHGVIAAFYLQLNDLENSRKHLQLGISEAQAADQHAVASSLQSLLDRLEKNASDN